jgi:hypothetical protein
MIVRQCPATVSVSFRWARHFSPSNRSFLQVCQGGRYLVGPVPYLSIRIPIYACIYVLCVLVCVNQHTKQPFWETSREYIVFRRTVFVLTMSLVHDTFMIHTLCAHLIHLEHDSRQSAYSKVRLPQARQVI